MSARGAALALMLLAGAAPAQDGPRPVAPAPAPAPLPPVDPARLAAARLVVDRIWPVGSYARMLHASLNGIGRAAAAGVNDMLARDPDAAAALGKPDPDDHRTPAQRAADDKARAESMRAAQAEMDATLAKLEPGLREGLATAYARRFTAAELADMGRFFDTSTGRHYAAESIMIMSSPDVMNATMAATQQLFGGMAAGGKP